MGRKDLAQKYYLKIAQTNQDSQELSEDIQKDMEFAVNEMKKNVEDNYGKVEIKKMKVEPGPRQRFLGIPVDVTIYAYLINIEADWFAYGGGSIRFGVGEQYKSTFNGEIASGSADMGSIFFHRPSKSWSGNVSGEKLAEVLNGRKKIGLNDLFVSRFRYGTINLNLERTIEFDKDNIIKKGSDDVIITVKLKRKISNLDKLEDSITKKMDENLERENPVRFTKLKIGKIDLKMAGNELSVIIKLKS